MKGLIRSLESAPVGDGDLVGEPFRVLPYQRKFLDRGFREPGILRAGLDPGPWWRQIRAWRLRWRWDSIRPRWCHCTGWVVKPSSWPAAFAQARIIFEAVKTSLELMGEDGEYRIRDQQNLADIPAPRNQSTAAGGRVRQPEGARVEVQSRHRGRTSAARAKRRKSGSGYPDGTW